MTDTDVQRFTTRRPPIVFWVDDDQMRAAGQLPADTLRELLTRRRKLQKLPDSDRGEAALDFVTDMLEMMLDPESMDVVRRRMKDQADPIGLTDLTDIMQWLIGRYAGRPTQSPPPSTDGSSGDGPSSTDGAPPATSTPTSSPPTGT